MRYASAMPSRILQKILSYYPAHLSYKPVHHVASIPEMPSCCRRRIPVVAAVVLVHKDDQDSAISYSNREDLIPFYGSIELTEHGKSKCEGKHDCCQFHAR